MATKRNVKSRPSSASASSTRHKPKPVVPPTPVASAEPTKEEVIADLLHVQKTNPDVAITRNFYRAHGKFSEGVWQWHFPRFIDFCKAAGIAVDASGKTKPEEPDTSGLVFKDNYTYNESTDTYITFLDRCGKRISLSGAKHRGMLQRYSNWDGQPSTINEICRDFGIRRDWFQEYKAVHGWTHDKEPFSDEELLERPEEDMVKDAIQMKRLSLFQGFEKAKWQDTKKNAAKWLDFEQSVFEPLVAHIQANLPTFRAPMLNIKASKIKFAAVVPAFDLHYGEHGWEDETGQSYSRKQARELLLFHSNELAKYFANFGKPEKIIIASASDYMHIDNPQGSTTAFTPQDTDGTRSQILIEGCELAVEHTDTMAQIAPIEWLGVPGNHDQDSALSVMLYLRATYRNNKRIQIEVSPSLQRCTSYGNSALAFFHGHGIKVANMQAVMSKKFRMIWRNTDRHYVFSGHLHHEVTREINGIKHFQVPSLSGTDRYHAKNGFITSDAALQAFLVSRDRGIFARFDSLRLDSTVITGVKMKKSA